MQCISPMLFEFITHWSNCCSSSLAVYFSYQFHFSLFFSSSLLRHILNNKNDRTTTSCLWTKFLSGFYFFRFSLCCCYWEAWGTAQVLVAAVHSLWNDSFASFKFKIFTFSCTSTLHIVYYNNMHAIPHPSCKVIWNLNVEWVRENEEWRRRKVKCE